MKAATFSIGLFTFGFVLPLATSAAAQTGCVNPNRTILNAQLSTGFKVSFLLERNGERLTGRTNAWQTNGITAGHGFVSGNFGGIARQGRGIVLNVNWDNYNRVGQSSFTGYLYRGQGTGNTRDLGQPSRQVQYTMTTSSGCPIWPEPPPPPPPPLTWRDKLKANNPPQIPAREKFRQPGSADRFRIN